MIELEDDAPPEVHQVLADIANLQDDIDQAQRTADDGLASIKAMRKALCRKRDK